MSGPEADVPRGVLDRALVGLDEAAGEVLAELGRLRQALEAAEDEGRELREALRRFTGGEEDPADLFRRLRALEEENALLRTRMREGREVVDRVLARIRFMEEQE